MIAIIDYGVGNLFSLQSSLKYLGEEVEVTSDTDKIRKADRIILPGVGAFGDAMERLERYGMDETLKEVKKRGIPLLGICLGLQLFFDESEETPGVKGLGLLKGRILRIPDQDGTLKIPHMGWNSLTYPNRGRLFEGIPEETYVYFVHSYYLHAEDPSVVTATTEYGTRIDASVEKENLFACQFHPEKSSSWGLKILENFFTVH